MAQSDDMKEALEALCKDAREALRFLTGMVADLDAGTYEPSGAVGDLDYWENTGLFFSLRSVADLVEDGD